jgi:hypothetical protein
MKNEIRILTGCSLIKGEFCKKAVTADILNSIIYTPVKKVLPLAKFIVLLE